MPKMEEITAPQSSETTAEKREPEPEHHGMNGSIGPVYNPPPTQIPRLIIEVEQGMEVDDNDQEIPDQVPELHWNQDDYDARSTCPPSSHMHRSRPFDAVTISSTRSLYDSDLEYHVENNRRYVPNYFMPNDEDEQLRLQIIHQVYLFLFDSQLTTIPLENPTKILDIGTGTGEWACGMGEAFPEADITGIDLSAIQPSAVPPNVFFEVFDAEDDDDWTYPENFFDLIHFRNMTGSFRSWDQMYERAFRHLKPGGWIEVVDFDDQSNSFASYFPNNSEVHAWFIALAEATMRSGKDINPAHLQPEKMTGAGFEDVKIAGHNLPMGAWPTDPDIRSTAKLWLVACLAGFEAISLRPLTRDLGWSADEVRRICSIIETELRNVAYDRERAKGLSVGVKIVVGRKPLSITEPQKNSFEMPTRLEVDDALEVDDQLPEGKRFKNDNFEMGLEELIIAPPVANTGTTNQMSNGMQHVLEMRQKARISPEFEMRDDVNMNNDVEMKL